MCGRLTRSEASNVDDHDMLVDADGGTDLVAVHDGLPRGVSTVNNGARASA
jgi:hypothetical protein